MIQIKQIADCCGCTACASICNHKAITMTPDALGFLYPVVNMEKCTDCGLCEKVCAFNDHYDTSLNLPEPIAYGARHKDINEVMKSRSGAVYVTISDYILENGGVVYGAGYTDRFSVAHKRATTKEERDEFRGSKYVQSDMNTIFHQVKQDLKDGFIVLFSGTPCQNAGLKSFINKKLQKKLYCIDIVCHAVPSPFVWRDYIKMLENRYKSDIVFVDFRDKTKGWAGVHEERYVFSNGKVVNRKTFTEFFYRNLNIRHSCNVCPYTNLQRPSDITLGDFWGFEKSVPDMNPDNMGLSLVLLNSEKGEEIFNIVSDSLVCKKVSLTDILQPNLCSPTQANDEERTQFTMDYSIHGIEYVACKYSDWSKFYFLKQLCTKFKNKFLCL